MVTTQADEAITVGKYTYYFHACTPTLACANAATNGPFCQTQTGSAGQYGLGTLQSAVFTEVVPKKMISISFYNGDPYGSGHRQSNLVVTCAPQQGTWTVVENTVGQYNFSIAHPVACGFNPVVSPPPNPNAGLVRHIVGFRFLPNVTLATQQYIQSRYLALKTLCVNQTTGKPYIVSFDTGTPNSLEGFQHNMTQIYISTFASVAARNFFVGRPITYPYDPYHDAFKQLVGPFLYQPIDEGLIVIDFSVIA